MKQAFGGLYAGRRVLVTGDSGFKGSWLVTWLQLLGAELHTVSLAPPTHPSLFDLLGLATADGIRRTEADICKLDVLSELVAASSPEVIFHLAAQSLVRASYDDPVGTFATNVMGTAHLLEAVRRAARPCAVIICTSDKCYENREWVHGYRETDALGGHDPYSASKGAAELVAGSYRSSLFPPSRIAQHGVSVATVRAGNVIGPGDWARDRVVADCVRALTIGEPIRIRNPHASRPWQHVLEPLAGYLALGAQMLSRRAAELAEAWNFGPPPEASRSVRDLVDEFIAAWGSGSWQDVSDSSAPHEAMQLRLSIDKAVTRLGWRPVWPFETAVKRTANGYQALAGGGRREALAFVRAEIEAYTEDARTRRVSWA